MNKKRLNFDKKRDKGTRRETKWTKRDKVDKREIREQEERLGGQKERQSEHHIE